MRKTTLIAIILFFLSYGASFAQGGSSSAEPAFAINSQTLIVGDDGNVIDFSRFISLQPGKDYGNITPKFSDSGELISITIELLRPLTQPLATTTPKPKPATKPVNTPRPTTAPSKPVKKFRFTTASELKGLYAPYYEETGLDGKVYSSNTMAGKVVVVKFWFTACAPCIREIPELNRLVSKFSGKDDVVFIAPATDDREKVLKFLQRRPFKYKVLADAFDIHGGFKVAGYPTHLVINKSGYVQEVITGENIFTGKILEDAITKARLMEYDDQSIDIVQGQVYYNDGVTVVKDENGKILSKQEYLTMMGAGGYNLFRKIKVSGREEYVLIKQ